MSPEAVQRAAAARGLLAEDDHDPHVAVGVFTPREAPPSPAERALVCTSWERFDRAYARAPDDTRAGAVDALRELFSELGGAPPYEAFGSHHRVVARSGIVCSFDAEAWRAAFGGLPVASDTLTTAYIAWGRGGEPPA